MIAVRIKSLMGVLRAMHQCLGYKEHYIFQLRRNTKKARAA